MMTAGDGISQTVLEKKKIKDVEGSRLIRFGIIGTCFVLYYGWSDHFDIGNRLADERPGDEIAVLINAGPTLHGWYMKLDKIFGVSGPTIGFKKMILDQFGFAPCFIFAFLCLSGSLQYRNFKSVEEKVKQEYFSILKANYVLWPAAQLITFYLVPLQYRVLYVSAVALLWNTYLAWKTNKTEKVC